MVGWALQFLLPNLETYLPIYDFLREILFTFMALVLDIGTKSSWVSIVTAGLSRMDVPDVFTKV